jgi:5-deoxy-glucuronate isomerase
MASPFYFPAGTLADDDDLIRLSPARAGWRFCGLRVVALAAGAARRIETGPDEVMVLPTTAEDVTVDVDGSEFHLDGRPGVFARVTDFVYAGRDSTITLTSPNSGEVALPSARCTTRLPPARGPAENVMVDVRGAGPATRQVTNFASPDAWEHADKLMCVEVLTPDGNWSSYPPHRHDDSPECPVNNEEIYYFRIGRTDPAASPEEAFGLHRTYTPDGSVDDNLVVRDGDVYVIPRGYHGPCVSPPGYPMYYLNVLAGPGGQRSMVFCDDPAHHWVRESWEGQPTDPRCPMTTASAPRRG